MAEIEGLEQVNRALSGLPEKLIRNVIRVINSKSLEMKNYIITEHLTGGTTDTRLRVRSGRLRGSLSVIKAKNEGDRIEGGVSIGTIYARTHFGPEGQETTIVPKNAKYLTIPLPAAMTGAGVGKGLARTGPWGETFIAKSKAGNLIIYGKQRYMKGKRIGQLRSQIIPLFLLKKSVTIRARIHPEDILSWIAPKVRESLISQGIQGVKVVGE